MKKKDPVLWVVVDNNNKSHHFFGWPSHKQAVDDAEFRKQVAPSYAPFRVVKYLPAPKPKRKRKA